MKILETDRLYLRELSINDAQAFYDLNADKEVLKWTGDVPFESVDSASDFLDNYNEYHTNGFGRWAVILKSTNNFIGWCGLKLNEEKLIDIGFRFQKQEWNKGYATESAKAVLNYGFKHYGIKEIIARVDCENKASLQVIKKLKMKHWKQENNIVYYKLVNLA